MKVRMCEKWLDLRIFYDFLKFLRISVYLLAISSNFAGITADFFTFLRFFGQDHRINKDEDKRHK